MPDVQTRHAYDSNVYRYDRAHARWLRYAGGEAQCAFEGAVTALLRPGMRMLDVACGTGTVCRRLLKAAPGALDLVLLDASARMLEQCKDIPAERRLGCMRDLPFDNATFDLLTCAWGIETLPDPQPALAEFIRVTRPGGQVCLVFCADRPARSLIGRALRHNIHQTGKGSFLSPDQLCEISASVPLRHIQLLHCSGPAAAMILHI